jgi:DNA-binding transcriptional ArsR family regulator
VTTPLYRLKAEFFKTLGHPARVRILELLAEQDHTLSELSQRVGMDSAHLTHQLAVLRRSGIVAEHRTGNLLSYSIGTDVGELMAAAHAVLTNLLTGRSDLLQDLRAAARTHR